MQEKDKIEALRHIIDRYDHFYDAVNNKANFWLAFNSFAIGAVLATYKDFKALVNCALLPWFNGSLVAFLLVTVASIALILAASFPYLKKSNIKCRDEDRRRSIIFFSDVASFTEDAYKQECESLDELKLRDDMNVQAHLLAGGLRRKYLLLNWAGWLIAADLMIFTFLLFIFTISQ